MRMGQRRSPPTRLPTHSFHMYSGLFLGSRFHHPPEPPCSTKRLKRMLFHRLLSRSILVQQLITLLHCPHRWHLMRHEIWTNYFTFSVCTSHVSWYKFSCFSAAFVYLQRFSDIAHFPKLSVLSDLVFFFLLLLCICKDFQTLLISQNYRFCPI